MPEPDLSVFPFDTPPELDAEPEYAWLRRHDPVPKVRLAPGGEAYLITRYDDVRRVYTDPVFSRAAVSAPGVAVLRPVLRNPYLMLSLDAPEHTRVRRLVARAFTSRSVEMLRPRIEQMVDELIDRMTAQGPPADFVAAFAGPLPAMVISELMGVPHSDHERLRSWMDIVLSVTAYPAEEVRAAAEQMFGYLQRLIEAKRTARADDVLSRMIEAHEEGDRLSAPELVNNTYILLIGGYETTAALLANSILTLHRHPDQSALVRDKPELIPDAGGGAAPLRAHRQGLPGAGGHRRRGAERCDRAGRLDRHPAAVLGQPRRVAHRGPRPPRRDPPAGHPHGVRLRHPPLHRRPVGATGDTDGLRTATGPPARPAPGRGRVGGGVEARPDHPRTGRPAGHLVDDLPPTPDSAHGPAIPATSGYRSARSRAHHLRRVPRLTLADFVRRAPRTPPVG